MIGIIGAMNIEVEKLKAVMTEAKLECVCGVDFVVGILWGVETVVAVSGVGKVNAAACTQTMIMKYSPELIINSGVAGGLEGSLNVCDIVVASDVVQHDMDTSPLGDPIGFISGIDIINIPCDKAVCDKLLCAAESNGIHSICGTIASGDQFIGNNEKKQWIVSAFNAYACEMEGAAIGQVCYKCGVPFAVLRSISDNADNSAPLSYAELTEKASDNLICVLNTFYNKLKNQ